MAFSHAECVGQQLAVVEGGVSISAHCYVDFSGVSRSDAERKSKKLAAFGKERGWLFQP